TAQDQPGFDLDEDLFDFAGAAREEEAPEPEQDLEEIFASIRDASATEELLGVPRVEDAALGAASEARVLEDEPAPSARPAPRPHRARASREPAPRPAPRAEEEPAPASPAPSARPRRFSFSRGVVAIAVSVTLLNSLLAVVMMKGSGEHDVRATGAEPPAREDAPRERTSAAEPALPDPESAGPAHGHPTLDEA